MTATVIRLEGVGRLMPDEVMLFSEMKDDYL